MTSILTKSISRLLLLPSFLLAAGFLVKGYNAVGDGFSAGIIAATGVALQYLAFGYREADRLLHARFAPALAMIGMLVVLGVFLVPLARGDAIGTHSPPLGSEVPHLGSLGFGTALLFDVGIFLLVLGFATSAVRMIAPLTEGEDDE